MRRFVEERHSDAAKTVTWCALIGTLPSIPLGAVVSWRMRVHLMNSLKAKYLAQISPIPGIPLPFSHKAGRQALPPTAEDVKPAAAPPHGRTRSSGVFAMMPMALPRGMGAHEESNLPLMIERNECFRSAHGVPVIPDDVLWSFVEERWVAGISDSLPTWLAAVRAELATRLLTQGKWNKLRSEQYQTAELEVVDYALKCAIVAYPQSTYLQLQLINFAIQFDRIPVQYTTTLLSNLELRQLDATMQFRCFVNRKSLARDAAQNNLGNLIRELDTMAFEEVKRQHKLAVQLHGQILERTEDGACVHCARCASPRLARYMP
jgi:hypothetical protein